MGNHNSLEVYTSLTVHLFHDIAQCYHESSELNRDIQKMSSRYESEGMSFFTKSLPSLCKAIDMALHSDAPLLAPGFKKIPGTKLPKLMGWLLRRVFDDEGYVRNDADVTALQHIRQFLYFTYKLKLPYDSTTEESTVEAFISTQEELSDLEIPSGVDSIVHSAAAFLCRLLDGFNVRDIVPRHGPGAVSTGEETGEKSNFSRIYSALERVYPFTEYFVLGDSQVADQLQWIEGLVELDSGTAAVVLVPKDSRGPRLISKEPLEYQWIQQGIRERLYSWIEEHPLTRGFINFSKQSINRRLALEASRTQKYVTLDMKDASDLVSLQLVERLFAGTGIYDALVACRSTRTRLPDGREVPLNSFAPMGSALCFPIEALVFYALAVAVLQKHKRSFRLEKDGFGLDLSRENNRSPSVYVYGDDIIVKREDFAYLLQYFPSFGLKFNTSKCCVSGFFRESCGCDAFKGIDVTPIRLRNTWSHSRISDPGQLVSYVSLSNDLWERGYWRAATYIKDMVEDLYGLLPYTKRKENYRDFFGRPKVSSSTYIGWYRSHVDHHVYNRNAPFKRRFNASYQRSEIKTWIVRPVFKQYETDGWKEMLRTLTCGSKGPTPIGVYALPHRVCLRRGWVAD